MRGSDWERTIRDVEVLICTPSILSRYSPEQFPNLRTVATAGEPISAKYVALPIAMPPNKTAPQKGGYCTATVY